MVRYFGLNPWDSAMTADKFRAAFNPYKYGYAVEVAVKGDGSTDVTKQFAMGRSAFELAYVMPDRKTVYYSDDGTNVGLFMFVADVAGPAHLGQPLCPEVASEERRQRRQRRRHLGAAGPRHL